MNQPTPGSIVALIALIYVSGFMITATALGLETRARFSEVLAGALFWPILWIFIIGRGACRLTAKLSRGEI